MQHYFYAENIYRIWKSVTVDFSITAEKGNMVAIVGKSGSGKSTILRIIAGLETQSKREDSKINKIILDGQNITNVSPYKRNIGMVFQNNALFPHLTVIENIMYGLICKGVKKNIAIEKAKQYLEQFNMTGFENRMPDTLSGGEAGRVSLARTLITKVPLILFDEPLSALDVPLRKKLAKEIKESQKKENFTGIFVTHDINEAKYIADKIILIENGKKKWEGKSSNFKEEMI